MDVLWTSAEIAAATGGRAVGRWTAGGVSVDPDAVRPGDVYVALTRENSAAGSVEQAYAAGAAAVLVERRHVEGPALVAPNAEDALRGLAAAARDRSPARRVAVAGEASAVVADVLTQLLGAGGPAYGPEAGLSPRLSLARMPRGCARAVFRLGDESVADLRESASLVRPHVAVITDLAAGGMDAAAAIFAGLENWGAAVIPGDDPQAQALGEQAGAAGAGWLVRFGVDPQAEAQLISFEADGAGGRGHASIFGRGLSFTTSSADPRWGLRATASLAAAYLTETPMDAAIAALAQARLDA